MNGCEALQRTRLIPSQVVEHSHVGIGVVEVVGVGWVVFFGPAGWQRTVKIENVVLGFRLIVHAVETHHLAKTSTKQQSVSFGAIAWISCDLILTWSKKRCSSG